MRGEVYFFDTPTLDLWSRGIIVRVRRGITADLTVKVRPSNDKEIQGVSGPNTGFKCELDLTGGTAVPSHSIQIKFNVAVPLNGREVFEMLSSAQKDLIDQVHSSIDWNRVRRIAEIKSTDWKIYDQPPFPKLVLEFWEWPTGSVLELSAKVPYDAATTAYSGLQRLAAEKKLSPSSKQTAKTTLALGDIAHLTLQ